MPGTRPNRRRGYTVLELVVVIAITGSLLLLMVAWVSSLMRASTASIGLSVAGRDGDYVVTQLRSDLTAATTCAPFGFGVPLAMVARDEVHLYADVVDDTGTDGTDGTLDFVLWRFDDVGDTREIQRAVIPGDAESGCGFDPADAENLGLWKTLAIDVKDIAPGEAYITPYEGLLVGTYYGSCTGDDAESCLYDSMLVSFTFTKAAGIEVPTFISESFEIDLSTSNI